jgi:hypothetical protein
MKSQWDACRVSSGQTRVPAQEVHNSWSDRWIVLKFLLEFLEAVFLSVALKLLLENHNIWSGHTKNQTRVPAQEVRNSWSDRWIVLKFLQEFQEACFLGVAMKSPRDTAGVSSGHTRVPAQEVYNSWSDRWIVLKLLHEFHVRWRFLRHLQNWFPVMICGSAATQFLSMISDSARFYMRWRFQRHLQNYVPLMISGSGAT